MRILVAAGMAACASIAAVALFLGYREAPVAAAANAVPVPVSGYVAHEWGTFTSFAGSDGMHVGFTPNNVDLPGFVYHQIDPLSKGGYLVLAGKVSMETPVIYFYANQDTRVAVNVGFPQGWLTEWYPVATVEPGANTLARKPGQSMRWDVKVLANEMVKFPEEEMKPNHYYHARETDASPVQVIDPRNPGHNGGQVVQSEKFLFYRGVGAFTPPVTVRAQGGNKVTVHNSGATPVSGLVLMTARGGKVAFTPLADVAAKGQTEATLPEDFVAASELGAHLVKQLTAAGLYEKEAQAMVKTWDSAWFGEDGHRLLYLVPRTLTDELLPLTLDPKPTKIERVLVGRHDFVTPEQEADVEKQVRRVRAAQAELDDARQTLRKVGRFADDATRLVADRLDRKAGK